MKLAEVFANRNRVDEALKRYEVFADESEWSVEHKFKLYASARDAWNQAASDNDRLRAFKSIISALKSDWQIARPGGLTISEESIFRTLDSHSHALRLSRPSEGLQTAFAPIESLRNVKAAKTSWRSPMAFSKILHFFNPHVYPIFDTAIVSNIVLDQFRSEWAGFEPSINVIVSWPHTGTV